MAELAAAAGLLDVFAFALDLAADGFAVGHLRLADVRFHLELAPHAVDDDFEVQLAHARMMVCADSSSVDTRNEGSSFARRCSARLIFSWSACVFGSTATEMTGIGMVIFSSVMTFSRSESVSPV